MSPADLELAKTLIGLGVELGAMIAGLFDGQRPDPKRIRAVWPQIEQALAKHETDAAETERWLADIAKADDRSGP